MIIKNCKIIFKDKIQSGSVRVSDGKIQSINPKSMENDEIIDAQGLYLSPGFIDIHIHGAGGCDTMDGSYEALNTIAKTIAKHGTTSFLPTTMTCSAQDIIKAVEAADAAKHKKTEGAEILGVHLEGPFLNISMIGAQNPKYILKPSVGVFKELVNNNFDIVKTVTLAPEIDGALELISFLKDKGITASMGHTNATYEEALAGIKHGINHATHLFNAMTGLHHRAPGAVGAIFDNPITTEVICDGLHIAYPSLRVALKQKTPDNMVLITDAMMACSMSDGEYSLGGQAVFVKDGAARLANSALAGSILTLDKAVKNLYENTDYSLEEIVKMATFNAARHCRVDDKKGQIKEGYDADLILFDEEINVKFVMVGGKRIH